MDPQRPWHFSADRRCSCKEKERTGFSVIWHTVKDLRNLHSNCVPVGRAELCLSLAMLRLAPVPKLASVLLRELEGGLVSEFTVAGCHLSPSSTYSNIRIHWHVYTHTHAHTLQRGRELSTSVFQRFYKEDLICLGFLCWNAENGLLLFLLSATSGLAL